MKDLVLVVTLYLDNGWYGDNHRIILSEADGVGFTRKGDARKFATKLKEYARNEFRHKTHTNPNWKKEMHIECEERATFISYQHVSAGPSISYTHHDITVDELLTSLSE